METKTDRELLKLAAKAMGIEGEVDEYPSGYVEMGSTNWFDRTGSNVWAPFHDDGQALRLAVELHIGHDCFVDGDRVEHCCAWVNHRSVREFVRVYEPYEGNPAKATRRAIVRVAAELGAAHSA